MNGVSSRLISPTELPAQPLLKLIMSHITDFKIPYYEKILLGFKAFITIWKIIADILLFRLLLGFWPSPAYSCRGTLVKRGATSPAEFKWFDWTVLIFPACRLSSPTW